MERVIDVTAARRRLGTLLDEVFHRGDVVTIKRKGKALAKIVPIEAQICHSAEAGHLSATQARLLDELNSLPTIGIDQDPVKILRTLREQKRNKITSEYGA